MKRVSMFLISITLFYGMIKLVQKSRAHLRFFTRQELEILSLLAVGCKDNEIAELLHTSQQTVEKYLGGILRKLNLQDISSAIEYALERDWVSITYA